MKIDNDQETADFAMWASETSRHTQDLVGLLLDWAHRNEYYCVDDLPLDFH